MFKRTAVAFSLLALSSIAAAQQPIAWPWQPVQVWAIPANGQAMPFPTPFWLWVVPPGVAPASAPSSPAAVVPPAAKPPQVEVAPVPAQIASPVAAPATAPAPVTVPAATPLPVSPAVVAAKPVAPAEPPADRVVATPLPPAAAVAPVETLAVPSGVEASPSPVKRAPVAKKIKKPAAGTPARQVRKLCFKGGKLDVCQ